MDLKGASIKRLLPLLDDLTATQLDLLADVAGQFSTPRQFKFSAWQLSDGTDFLTQDSVDDLGDVIRLHHVFSREAFSKDKFEYALERVLKRHGHQAALAPRGNHGYDIAVGGERLSLKTEASKTVQVERIHISKFMELGGGTWGTNPDDLIGLRQQFLSHLAGYDHVMTLRRLKEPRENWHTYELVLIPKPLLSLAANGTLEMMRNSSQTPKPGYCYVGRPGWVYQQGQRVRPGDLQFALYFDGGGERKLQIKHLDKALCSVLAAWSFQSLPA